MSLAQHSDESTKSDSNAMPQEKPNLGNLSDLDLEAEAREITDLLQKLYTIYSKEYFYEFPSQALQFSHTFDFYSKIVFDFNQNPLKSIRMQEKFLDDYISFFFSTTNRLLGFEHDELTIKKPPDDNRFNDPAWNSCFLFERLEKAYYLMTKQSLKWLGSINTLDKKSRQQLHFYLKNWLNLISPTNFIATNPKVIQETMESSGQNLLRGYKNYLEDLVLNQGRPNIRMTDTKAFKVGKNLGITPGKVIFQNDLMQLIQYLPSTAEVYQTPILFVPPWINKYYILDLTPENSLVKWLVDQGFTVYMISWVNPDASLAQKGFSDYMQEGPLQAIDVIFDTAKPPNIHTVGYCIGGTLLGCALSVLEQKNDKRIASSTYLMTLLNFGNPGELGVFINKAQIDALDKLMQKKGYLDGRLLNMVFNVLRPNDLIWPYFIHNYLLGKPSKPFDLLYWNADSSNLTQKMYSFYLRSMYLHNSLRKPGKIKLEGYAIRLQDIKVPSYFLSSETDHITLWRSVYASANLLNAPIEFVLAGSGHVRGVINPPSSQKYNYKTSKKYSLNKKLPQRASDWLNSTKEFKGSWWPHWKAWLTSIDNQMVAASSRDPRLMNIPILEDAPGSYVLKRL